MRNHCSENRYRAALSSIDGYWVIPYLILSSESVPNQSAMESILWKRWLLSVHYWLRSIFGLSGRIMTTRLGLWYGIWLAQLASNPPDYLRFNLMASVIINATNFMLMLVIIIRSAPNTDESLRTNLLSSFTWSVALGFWLQDIFAGSHFRWWCPVPHNK